MVYIKGRQVMTKAKVFRNGRSQAIRLPKEFRVSTDEVYLQKTPDGFIVTERDPWEVFEEGARELSEGFFNFRRDQSPPQKRNWPA
jgi:antitoxin VapB